MILRILQEKDIPQCKEIWSEIFKDSAEFIDWFFSNRFSAELGVCSEDNGKIVSVIHGYPMPIKYFNSTRKGAMMSGVATLPSYRGQGLMHKLIKLFTENLQKKGFELIIYKAANPEIYYSCDHYPCTMQGHFTYSNNYNSEIKLTDKFNPEQTLRIYTDFTEKYNGIVLRDEKLMSLRAQDFFVDNGKFCMLEDKAYCFYTEKENSIFVHELCYRNPEDVFTLLNGISAENISGVLPADFPLKERFLEFIAQPHGTIVPISGELIPKEPLEFTIGKRTEKLLLCPSTFIFEEY
ncbi:MAG: GNAT family N-acetyltransferase [Ruminococcaceae bacterium]|nr:GNAT family N-acetyltransferase [Oscillospiraceae bacterium]